MALTVELSVTKAHIKRAIKENVSPIVFALRSAGFKTATVEHIGNLKLPKTLANLDTAYYDGLTDIEPKTGKIAVAKKTAHEMGMKVTDERSKAARVASGRSAA